MCCNCLFFLRENSRVSVANRVALLYKRNIFIRSLGTTSPQRNLLVNGLLVAEQDTVVEGYYPPPPANPPS